MALLNNKEKQRVLVTGDKGFIGSHIVQKLNEKLQIIPMNAINDEKIDILDRNALKLLENVEVIVHLASKTSIMNSINDPFQTYMTNILGTLNILDFAKQNKIKKIVNFSTYVYGEPKYLPIDEIHPINPHSPYSKSKLIAEKLCEDYATNFGIDIVTLRPFYIYGPYANVNTFFPKIIKEINQNGRVLLSSSTTKRDFLFIDDLIELLYKILLNFPRGYNVFNVGYGKSYKLKEVVEIIMDILEKDIQIEYNGSIRPHDIENMVADVTLVEKSYSWKPRVDLRTGIRLTIGDVLKISE